MTSDLTGQRVLVTAAAQGIGRATAQAFARAGARVLATDINAPGLAGLDGCETARLDVLDAECVAEVCARAGAVDVLFNAAGVVHSGTVRLPDDEAATRALLATGAPAEAPSSMSS